MIRRRKTISRLLFLGTLSLPVGGLMALCPAQAAATPYRMPQSSRIVVFRYSPYQTYTILARPMAVTDIQLAPGERLESFAVGDTVQWITALAPGNILIKPVKPGLFTSATIITNDRVYELTLRSSPLTGSWYQQVSWKYPQILLYNQQVASRQHQAAKRATHHQQRQEAGHVNNPSTLNFDYKVRGRAAFRPRIVFDNGVFTWIRLPKHAQVTPALFIKADGKFALTRYIVKGHYLIVQRTFHRAVLREGRHTITIIDRHRPGHPARRHPFPNMSDMSAGG